MNSTASTQEHYSKAITVSRRVPMSGNLFKD